MMVKLWMRNFAQQNLNRFPPANGGYAGVRPTFKSCAPTKPARRRRARKLPLFSGVGSLAGGTHRFCTFNSGQRRFTVHFWLFCQ